MKTLDPDTRQLLALARQAGYPPFQALTPENARSAYAAGWASMQTDGGEVASVRDQSIKGPGGVLNLRIYRGAGTQANEALPCMLFCMVGDGSSAIWKVTIDCAVGWPMWPKFVLLRLITD